MTLEGNETEAVHNRFAFAKVEYQQGFATTDIAPEHTLCYDPPG